MPTDAFEKLAKHLDNLPGGFPRTDSGVELRILKRLFSPEEAELAVCCTLIPEEPRVLARRWKRPVDETAAKLEDMATRGLLFSVHTRGGKRLYMAAQYVVGIWEYQVNRLDKDLIADMREYMPHLLDFDAWQKKPQLRVVPVGRSVAAGAAVLPHENAEELVRQSRRFLTAPCICRTEHAMTGEPCDKPLETCLVFGAGVDYYLRAGIGREIDLDETLDILKQADKAGLVLQPSNSQKVINICTCCGCCCGVLGTLKTHPRPAEVVASPLAAVYDAATCSGCGVCVGRCQMDAFTQAAKKQPVEFDPHKCIGCGLCASTCPTGSLVMKRKDEAPEVPSTIVQTYTDLARARGKLSPVKMAWMGLQSKLDRALAAKA